ncbi:MAG: DUF4330 domain-containing protein [Clostridia bacterium]|nr:DUF4330 domain-containing protein [Clostridia bacterium]
MKETKTKGKLFSRFNLFDLFILLIIMTVAAGVYFVFIKDNDNMDKETIKVRYELLLEEPRKGLYIDAFSPGEKVYFKESDILIGTITGIKVDDAWEYEADLNGNWVRAKTEGFYNITLIIEADAVRAGDGYIIHGNWNAFKGTSIEFSTRRYTTIGMVVSLEEE